MESAHTSQSHPSGQMVFLDTLRGGAQVTEGELNLFLVHRMKEGKPGKRLFIATLLSGHAFFPEPPVIYGGEEYVLTVVASGEALTGPSTSDPEGWRLFLCEAVSVAARVRIEKDTVSDLLNALIEAEESHKKQRLATIDENRRLTDSTVARKLDVLRQVCGTGAVDRGGKEQNDHLELALRRIAQHYNLPFKDVAELHKQEDHSPQIRAQNFVIAANWRMRTVQLTPDCHRMSSRPLLAFYRANGAPVVLHLKASGSTYWDPALGSEPRPLTADVVAQLSPDAQYFYEPFPEGKRTKKDLLRFIFSTARPAIVTLLFSGMVASLIGLVMPVATQYVTGKIIPTANLPELWQLAFLLVVLTACQITLQVVPAFVMLLFGAQQYERFQAAVFDHVLRIPVTNFQSCDAGDMTQRILGATHVQASVFSVISGQFLGSIFSLVSLVMMFYYSVALAGVGTVVVLSYAILFFALSRLNLKPLTHQVAASGKMSGLLKQFFDGMSKIRGAGAEQQVLSRFLDDFSHVAHNDFIIARNGAILSAVTTAFPMLISVLFYALAGGFLDKNLPLPIFLAFMAAFHSFQGGLMGVSSGFWSLLAIEPMVKRIMPIIEAKPEDSGDRHSPGILNGAVEVSHLSFRYSPDAPLVLDDVSIKAAPGEFIAIVGPSGSGKSSLVRLLLGFEQQESGGIYYSGKDLATLELRSVRRQMGVILQSGKILSCSILENITTGTEYTLEDAWRALKLAAFDKEVDAMPMGIHTLVSAETISGGQQQRILIARALVGSPAIVIMDESTSALDNYTQDVITANMEQLRMTRIVIAHRLSTIVQADRIYVLEKGQIRQSGTYADLCAVDGLFKRLIERQIADTSVVT